MLHVFRQAKLGPGGDNSDNIEGQWRNVTVIGKDDGENHRRQKAGAPLLVVHHVVNTNCSAACTDGPDTLRNIFGFF